MKAIKKLCMKCTQQEYCTDIPQRGDCLNFEEGEPKEMPSDYEGDESQ